MKFDSGRNHKDFDLDGFKLRSFPLKNGQGHVVRAARDPVQVPTDLVIVSIAELHLGRLGLGVQCFTLTNVYGVERDVPYGASVEEWQRIAAELLQLAMDEDAK